MSHPASRTGTGRYAYRGRHRAATGSTTAVRTAAMSAGVIAAVMVGAAAPASAAPSADAWYRLRVCESGNNYRTNTGNGYYGAYQFDLSTWRSVGGSGLPSNASPAEQDYRARLLYRARGWAPWTCARMLGLRNDPSYGYGYVAVTPTIRAAAGAFSGTVVRVSGTARPGAIVEIWLREVTQSGFRHVRNVRVDGNGNWSTPFRIGQTMQVYARAEGRRSPVATTRVLVPTTIIGPRALQLGTTYRIAGKARPLGTVVVFFRAPGEQSYSPKRWVRADRYGRWSTPWRAATDYTYFARGDVRSWVTGTVVAPSTGPAITRLTSGPSRITVTGTARPSSALVVYVRATGSTRFVPLARTAVSATGQYAASFAAPSRSFDYFAMSSNGQISGLRHGAA